jgi:hypothetical protein
MAQRVSTSYGEMKNTKKQGKINLKDEKVTLEERHFL